MERNPTKQYKFDSATVKEWEKAAGFKLQDKSHCPFVMKADRIEFENKRLYLVFENMDMTLTQYIRKKG